MPYGLNAEQMKPALDVVKLMQRIFKEMTLYKKTSPETAEDYKQFAEDYVRGSGSILGIADFFTNTYIGYCLALIRLNHHDTAVSAIQAAYDYYSRNKPDFLNMEGFKELLEEKVRAEGRALLSQRDFKNAHLKCAALVAKNPQNAGLRLDYAILLALANKASLALEQLTKAKALYAFNIERKKNAIEKLKHKKVTDKTETTSLEKTIAQLQAEIDEDMPPFEAIPRFEENFSDPHQLGNFIQYYQKESPLILQDEQVGKKTAALGVQKFRENRYKEAAELFESALSDINDPNDAMKIYYNAGRAYNFLNNYIAACNSFNHAFTLSLQPYIALLKEESPLRLNPVAYREKVIRAYFSLTKYFISFTRMLRHVGNFETSFEMESSLLARLKKDLPFVPEPDIVDLLKPLEQSIEMTRKILPFIGTDRKELGPEEIKILEEYRRFESSNFVVINFIALRSTLNSQPNSLQLLAQAKNSSIKFIADFLSPTETTEDTSVVEMKELSAAAAAAPVVAPALTGLSNR